MVCFRSALIKFLQLFFRGMEFNLPEDVTNMLEIPVIFEFLKSKLKHYYKKFRVKTRCTLSNFPRIIKKSRFWTF